MNVVFCGGGTSGHIIPAVAISEIFEEKYPNAKITFIVRRGGKENEILKKRGYRIREIEIMGLKRKITPENLKSIKQALSAVKECEKILKELSLDCIIGTGGYVTWPVIIAGSRLKIPTFIHESNIYPGLVTRLLSPKCKKTFLCSEEAKRFLPKRGRYLVVGNPILKEYMKTTRKEARARLGLKANEKLVISFGGSIGAERLNETVIEAMKEYSAKEKNLRHIHATGARLYDECVKNWTPSVKDRCTILPYIENMPTLLRAADLVICRAGAMTIAEISTVGTPAIIVPSPHVAGNHQNKNAKVLSDKGAVIMLEEKSLTTKNIVDKMKAILNDKTLSETLSAKIKATQDQPPAEIICKEITNALKS